MNTRDFGQIDFGKPDDAKGSGLSHKWNYKYSHPEELILDKKEEPVKTISSIRNDFTFMGLLSLNKPYSIDQALSDDDLIVSM